MRVVQGGEEKDVLQAIAVDAKWKADMGQ